MPSSETLRIRDLVMNPEIVYVQGPVHLGRLCLAIKRLTMSSGPLGVDTETTGLDALTCRVRLLQLGIPGYALVLDLDGWRQEGHRQVPWDAQGLRLVKQLLCGNRMKVLQNAAFDLNFLWAEGIELGGEIFDTMFASQVKNNGNPNAKNNLGAIVKRVLHVELPKELQKADWAKELTPEMVEYAGRDATCLPLLQDRQTQALKETKLSSNTSIEHVYQLEQDVLPAVARMQHWGFKFDVAAAEALKQELSTTAEQLKLEFCELLDARLMRKHPEDDSKWLPRDPDGSLNLREKNRGRGKNKVLAGFNPRSVKQLKDRLQDAGVRLRPNEKGEPCLDQNLLAYLRSSEELIDKYLTYKASVTRVSHVETLLEAVGPDGRIHAGYKQMGTQTGRLSCARPNLQQVPRTSDFRSLFVAEPGWKLVVADFSQIELRVAAEMSKEERMIGAYKDGRDLHTETAALIAGVSLEEVTKPMRTSAKLCFSGDTEVLTDSGWVRLDEYGGQRVAQYVLPPGVELNRSVRKPGPGYVAGLPPAWDGNCGLIEFVQPLHYDSYVSEDVWRVADRNVDIVATGNHQIFYIDAYGNAQKKALVDVKSPREFVAAGYTKKEGAGLGVVQSRLLAMVVADGSFKQTPDWVSLGFSKRRKIKRCEDLLTAAGIQFTKSVSSNGQFEPTTFFKFRLTEADWLLDYVSKDKVLDYAMCMRHVDALAYLCEAQYWDGTALEGGKRDRVIVGTIVKQTADVMQAMAVTAGLPCSVHTEARPDVSTGAYYRVSYAFRTAPTWRPSWNLEKVEAQPVYCVQVPSELILIRRNGKVCVQGNCNFGLLYGAGPATLRKQAIAQYGIDMSASEAKELVDGFREAYPTLYQWQQDHGTQTTEAVMTMYGRLRYLYGFDDKYTTRINTVVQGSAGDIAKMSIKLLWDELQKQTELEAKLIAMVHDEIVLEVKEGVVEYWQTVLSKCMRDAGAHLCKTVPIEVGMDCGDTWADAK